MAVCAALCHAQGNVKGDIIDTSTGEALPFVNVAVYNRTTGEFVKGAVSDAEGAFNVTGLPYGQYTLKLSYIGYTTVTGEFALTERRRHANMKTMSMSEDSQTLEEVTVTAQRPSMRLEVDRKSFDVSQDISNAGGAASDVLENIPSVEVDTDGNISLRGNTNGSANASGNVNFNYGRWDGYVNIGYRHRASEGGSYSYQEYLNTNQYQTYETENDRRGDNLFTRAGLTFNATDKDALSLNGMMMLGSHKNGGVTPYRYGTIGAAEDTYVMLRNSSGDNKMRMFYGE